MPKFDPDAALADLRHEFGEHGGVNMSIEVSTTFTVMHAHTMPELFGGRVGPDQGWFLYGRHFNPTVYVLGRQIAAMEGAESGYCAASGMGAISATLLQLCDHGDHIVAGNTIYGGTFALLHDYLPRKAGITTTFVPVHQPADVAAAITPRTKALYFESMCNPTLRIANIPRLAEVARKHEIPLVIDNTFTPMIISPIQLGADIVVHSLTKFTNGASDVIGGAVVGEHAFINRMMDLHTGSLMLIGPTMDARMAFEVSMRLPHLGLRITEHSRRAMAFAERLQALRLDVTYPGLPHHPDHELLAEQSNEGFGMGGLLTLDVGTQDRAEQLMETLQNEQRFGYMAVSLGYYDTLMSCSAASTSSELSEEDQRRAGIKPGLIRMSVGISGTLEQRWQQLETGLRNVGLV